MNYFRLQVIVFSILIPLSVLSQDFRALRVGPNSGINAHAFNPSYHRTNDIKWDVNFIGAGIDISNNYFKWENTSAIRLFLNTNEIIDKIQSGIQSTDDIAPTFNIKYSNSKNTRAHIDLELVGPGFLLNFNKFSIGMFSKTSLLAHMNDFPNWKDSHTIADLGYDLEFGFPTADFSVLSLAELGLSFSTSIEMGDYSFLHLGVNLKNYHSTDIFYAQSLKPTIAIKKVDSLFYESGQFDAAFFTGFTYDEETKQASYSPERKGDGYGIDLGMTMELNENSYDEGSILIGASILDLGYIDYYNGFYHHITLDDGYILKRDFLDESITTELIKSLDIDDKFYVQFSPNKRVIAPATINLFGEYDFSENIVFNLSTRQNVPVISPIEKSSFINLTGQYNRRWFSYTLPLSLYNNESLKVGSAFRLGPLTLGTDNLFSLLLPIDISAANVFFNLNINSSMFPIWNRKKRGYKEYNQKKRGSRSNKKVKCYPFDF